MIGADISAALSEMRAHAESLMLDAGRALRATGNSVLGEDQTSVPEMAEALASRCKIQRRDQQAITVQVGERTAAVLRVTLHLPISTAPLRVGDEWEITAAGPLSIEPIGRRYRVIGIFEKSLATARRYEVEEVVT